MNLRSFSPTTWLFLAAAALLSPSCQKVSPGPRPLPSDITEHSAKGGLTPISTQAPPKNKSSRSMRMGLSGVDSAAEQPSLTGQGTRRVPDPDELETRVPDPAEIDE